MSASSPRAGLDAPAPDLTAEDERRLVRWFRISGLALIVGLGFPIVDVGSSAGHEGLSTKWLWDIWPYLDTASKAAAGLLAGLGVLLIALSFGRPSVFRSWLLVLAPLGVLVLHGATVSERPGSFHKLSFAGVPRLLLAIGASAAALAAANRLRKTYPEVVWIRVAALAAGAAGLALALLPFSFYESSIASSLLAKWEWETYPARNLSQSLVFLYFTSAILHAVPGSGRVATRAVSVLGRIAAAGIPLAVVVEWWMKSRRPISDPLVVQQAADALRMPVLLVYPALVALGLALVSVGHRIVARAPASVSPTRAVAALGPTTGADG